MKIPRRISQQLWIVGDRSGIVDTAVEDAMDHAARFTRRVCANHIRQRVMQLPLDPSLTDTLMTLADELLEPPAEDLESAIVSAQERIDAIVDELVREQHTLRELHDARATRRPAQP